MARPSKPKVSSAPKKTQKRVMFLIPSESSKPMPLPPLIPTPSPSHSRSSMPTPIVRPHPIQLLPHTSSPMYQSPVPTPHSPLVYALFGSGVNMDISLPPHHAPLHVQASFAEYATYPPVRAIAIISPQLPWMIHADPVTRATPFITVFDVLHALYTTLHKPITQTEFDAHSISLQEAISASWHNRLSRIPNEHDRAREKLKGVRRVDVLLGRTCIKGMGNSLGMPINGETTLRVDFGSGT